MTKQELIEHLAETEDIPFENAEAIVEEFLRLLEDRMKRGEETQIYSFGKFGVRWWKGRTGRDPQTGEEIELDGRWIPYWTPSPSLVDETEEYQAAVEAGKIDEKRDQESQPPADEPVESISEEQEPEPETESTPSAEVIAGEAVEESEQEEFHPAESLEEPAHDTSPEDVIEEEPVEDDQSEDESLPEPVDTFEPIPEEEVPEEEDDDTPEIPAFLFRESEEDEDIPAETDLPEVVDSDETFIDEDDASESFEETVDAEPAAGSEFEQEHEEPAEEIKPGWEEKAHDRAERFRAGRSDEEDMPWLYPEKKKSKNWVPTLLIVLLLIGIAGAAYYYMVDTPDFISNRNQTEPVDTFIESDQGSPAGEIDDESEEPAAPMDSDESASVSPDEVPEPDPATPIARSVSVPENLRPYIFTANGSGGFMEIYQSGLDLFQQGNYREAELVFQRLQISDPPDDYADNTQYWIGECKFGMRLYRQSIRAFEEVFMYPNTNKVDDSLIMMASAYIHLNEMNEAAEILRKFQGQYSDSQYAPIAKRWIARYNL